MVVHHAAAIGRDVIGVHPDGTSSPVNFISNLFYSRLHSSPSTSWTWSCVIYMMLAASPVVRPQRVPTKDFFLGRDFRNLGGNRKFLYPTRNCSTGQKLSADLNLNFNPETNKERMRLLSYRILWHSGSDANWSYSAHGRVFEFLCRINIFFHFF
jgi:hypothetical protein